MAIFVNFTPWAVAETAGLDREGAEWYALIVKASFSWDRAGRTTPLAASLPVAEEDQYAGKVGESSVVLESDLVPHKPRLDVLLLGALESPLPVPTLDATLEVGTRLHKTLRVFGERVWVKSLGSVFLSDPPVKFSRMPLVWERSFGGADPKAPACVERRNPSGTGLADKPDRLEGRAAPNFEDPRAVVARAKDRPPPAGFGPVGRHWLPRLSLAGTYDAAWQENVFPFLPKDFDARFYNCASEDQQLPSYVPGEEVRLTGFTKQHRERFVLPDWRVPVVALEARAEATTKVVVPDTLIIEPVEHRFSLVGRACFFPSPDALALRQVRVGVPSRGWLRANDTGKRLLRQAAGPR